MHVCRDEPALYLLVFANLSEQTRIVLLRVVALQQYAFSLVAHGSNVLEALNPTEYYLILSAAEVQKGPP